MEGSDVSAKYAEAQRNAQKAMALYKETREENEELRENFEKLKQAYQQLEDRARKSETALGNAKQEVSKEIRSFKSHVFIAAVLMFGSVVCSSRGL